MVHVQSLPEIRVTFPYWVISIKDRIYRNPPDSLEDLILAIRREIDALDTKTLQRVMKEFRSQICNTIIEDGRHFEQLSY